MVNKDVDEYLIRCRLILVLIEVIVSHHRQ